jgi:FdhD protein
MIRPAPPLRRSTETRQIVALRGGFAATRPDRLATEEPLEIRAAGPGQEPQGVAVTMRTPGHDFELAVGFLFTEGLIGPGDVRTVEYCEVPDGEQHYNVVTVRLARAFDGERLRRNFFATSSCGVCGKASMDQVDVRCDHLAPGPVVTASALAGFPASLRKAQRVFDQTGGLHAAAILSPDGVVAHTREDVGRHNAVDKLVGRSAMDEAVPLSQSVLMVSGRVSFELVQKAAVAGLPVLCAVSAPSSLAVETAERVGMTVVGFLREGGFNVYTGQDRIALDR